MKHILLIPNLVGLRKYDPNILTLSLGINCKEVFVQAMSRSNGTGDYYNKIQQTETHPHNIPPSEVMPARAKLNESNFIRSWERMH